MQLAKLTAPSRKKNNKGFSLIELIIVITIMAILTALLAPQLLRYVEQSRAAKDAVTMDEFARAVQLALTEEKVYGEITKDITLTYSKDGSISGFDGSGSHLQSEITKTLGGITGLPKLVSAKYTATSVNNNVLIDYETTGILVKYTPLA